MRKVLHISEILLCAVMCAFPGTPDAMAQQMQAPVSSYDSTVNPSVGGVDMTVKGSVSGEGSGAPRPANTAASKWGIPRQGATEYSPKAAIHSGQLASKTHESLADYGNGVGQQSAVQKAAKPRASASSGNFTTRKYGATKAAAQEDAPQHAFAHPRVPVVSGSLTHNQKADSKDRKRSVREIYTGSAAGDRDSPGSAKKSRKSKKDKEKKQSPLFQHRD